MTEIKSKFDLVKLTDMLRCDPYIANMDEIVNRLSTVGVNTKKQLIRKCHKALKNNEITLSRNENKRIAAVKLIIATAPLSKFVIESLLTGIHGKLHPEINFTLFCFLDHLQSITKTKSLQTNVLINLEKYLLNVKQNPAHAAWMAGDLLGGHWRHQKSLPILLKVAKGGKYLVGREAAVNGLGQMLTLCKKSQNVHNKIIATLEDISKMDRSKRVRTAASSNIKLYKDKNRSRRNKKLR